MPGFESLSEIACEGLCSDCPMKHMSTTVEMARLEVEVEGGDLQSTEEQLGAIEAYAAANLAMAAVYRYRVGCQGPIKSAVGFVPLGEDVGCPSYNHAIELITAE